MKLRVADFYLFSVGRTTNLSFSTSFMTSFSTSISFGKAIQSSMNFKCFSMIPMRFLRSGCLPTLVLKVPSN